MTATLKASSDLGDFVANLAEDQATRAFRTLMRTQLEQARAAVEQNLRAHRRGDAWEWLAEQVDFCCVIERPLSDGPVGFASAMMDALANGRDVDTTRATFKQMIERYEGLNVVWADQIERNERHALLEQSLIWEAMWHLTAAGVPLERIARAIGAAAPPAPLRSSRGERLAAFATTLQTSSQKAWTVAGPIARRAASGVVVAVATARAWIEAEQEIRRKALAAAKAEQERREAEEAKRRAEALATFESGATTSLPVDGRALHGSVFGTWLALVVASWVSLAWGALISLPFGVGLGIIASFMGGLIAVPMWGTFWGFFGMPQASASTERKMGFTPLPDHHPLAQETRRFAAALDLPMPKFGTVEAYNAFAIGMDRDSATVAVGRPLITNLTQQEVLAVIGHELGHVASGDMRRMMLMRTFQNATVAFGVTQGLKQFARWILCWFTELGILAFSRHREYWADAVGAALAGKDAMIGALQTLERGPALTEAEQTHARFMIRGRPFSTHPSTADRIAALQSEKYIKLLPIKRTA